MGRLARGGVSRVGKRGKAVTWSPVRLLQVSQHFFFVPHHCCHGAATATATATAAMTTNATATTAGGATAGAHTTVAAGSTGAT